LSQEEIAQLPLPLRLRHEYLLVSFKLAWLEVLELYQLGFKPVVLGAQEELLTPQPLAEETLETYQRLLEEASPEERPYLQPLAWAQKGFLYAPLLNYFALCTRARAEGLFLQRALPPLLAELRKRYPEPFGLLPED